MLESIFTDPLVQAVERLSRKGIVVVTAAGNKGINPATGVRLRRHRRAVQRAVGDLRRLARYPGHAATSRTITLRIRARAARPGSICSPSRTSSRPASTSSRLPRLGSRLFNEFENLRVPARTAHRILHASGTSMASPAVAGAAALLLKQNGGLSANTLKMALQFTARPCRMTDVLTQGAGA